MFHLISFKVCFTVCPQSVSLISSTTVHLIQLIYHSPSYSHLSTKKWSFLLNISSVNVAKSAVFLRIWSLLLKKSLKENFIFCAVYHIWLHSYYIIIQPDSYFQCSANIVSGNWSGDFNTPWLLIQNKKHNMLSEELFDFVQQPALIC